MAHEANQFGVLKQCALLRTTAFGRVRHGGSSDERTKNKENNSDFQNNEHINSVVVDCFFGSTLVRTNSCMACPAIVSASGRAIAKSSGRAVAKSRLVVP